MLARLTLRLSLALTATSLFAQSPDGTDTDKAIPVVFGQTVTDIADPSLAPNRVFKITLARGQKLTVLVKGAKAIQWKSFLLAPASTSIGRATILAQSYPGCCNTTQLLGFDYEVPAAGTYFVLVQAYSNASTSFTLQATTEGIPIAVPNPTAAGCLSGPINYITYSLQWIGVGLPDEVSIGGAKACASCAVKAPGYPEIANRIEFAMKARVNVEACYDASGNIFQIKLVQP